MLPSILRFFQLFKGRHYRKFLAQSKPIVARINQLESSYQSLSDTALQAKTAEFMQRYEQGTSLDQLLPEAFAVVKNAARRLQGKTILVCDQHVVWDMVHHDVQLIGGIALHQNKVAEMATGEGKTLVATLPLYLNALTGKNCQLVTVNDYLVRRDAEWMSALFQFLGLSVGYIQNSMDPRLRKQAYQCNITYGTACEFGFDYLRDNGMATRLGDQVQRHHHYCIIDEADSILIDEARTPLIISGEADHTQDAPFQQLNPDVARLVDLQQKLCNRLAIEAKEILEKEPKDAQNAWDKLYLVKLGSPKHKQLMRILENGAHRKAFEKHTMELGSDLRRDERYALKEMLYFAIDERQQQADLTEKGRNTLRPNAPQAFVLPDLPVLFSELDKQTLTLEQKQATKAKLEAQFAAASEEIHCLSQLLKAYCLYERDIQYVVQDGKVIIIDENTGRAMPGRRWSDGLHQAIECKEGVTIEKETKTYATITLQNYFRLYTKLAGMTGTAETEATEFFDIYKLSVVVIPTHKPCIRQDLNDTIFKTRRDKYSAVIADIQAAHNKGQPVLVGTASIESSEVLDKMLKRVNIPHTVLNAKFHQQEAEIITRAGQRGAVTIATNMAGRGTDIKLGAGVAELGGLFVIGTERHESRRIDRQFRGRCSRQGDPGMSKFFVSLEDDLMRLFANAGPIGALLQKSFVEGEPMEHPLLNRSIEGAQKKVEQQNFGIRKRLLQYDDVLNKQREIIYTLRNDALRTDTPRKLLWDLVEDELTHRLESLNQPLSNESLQPFTSWVQLCFPVQMHDLKASSISTLVQDILSRLQEAYKDKEAVEHPEALKDLERFILIRFLDKHWQDHLTEMEDLRRSVSLRGYGQKDPLSEYKSEAYGFFEDMLGRVREAVCRNIFRSATNAQSLQGMLTRLSQRAQAQHESHLQPAPAASSQSKPQTLQLPKLSTPKPAAKVGRNDNCPCGSGKKYKKCCGIGSD